MSAWEGLNPPYSTIVADPPWPHDDGWPAFSPTSQGGDTVSHRVLPYSSMTLAAIGGLPVAELSAPGGHLYLWATNRYLRAAYDVAEAWGFAPVTVLVWCKPVMGQGPGGRFSITTEFVLFCRDIRRAGSVIRAARLAAGLSQPALEIAVRGKPTRLSKRWEDDDSLPTAADWDRLQQVLPDLRGLPYPDVVESEMAKVPTTWFSWPRGRHSVKPAAFFDVVETVSPGPYVELFARAPRLGWDSWGKGYEAVVA